MNNFNAGAAGGALLAIGLTEAVAATTGRSLVDRAGRFIVDVVPLPVVEATVRLIGTKDKPLVRANLVGGAALVAGLVAPAVRHGRGAVPGVAAGAVGLAGYLSARRRLAAREAAHDASRRRIDVQRPLGEVTDGAEGWEGAEPLFTDVERFYQTDVNLRSPIVDPSTWSLDIVGLDGTIAQLSLEALLDLPLQERDGLLICVHNRLGWDRLGHQRWTGVGVLDLIDAAAVELPDDRAGVDLVMEAVDSYRQVLPLTTVAEKNSWVVVGMAGRSLTAGHGFPARVMTPGLVGQYNGVKWLRRLALVPSGTESATWVARGWPRREITPPLLARIDHPGTVAMPPRLPQGAIDVERSVTLVGTAWAPAGGGVADVQVRVDDGAWIGAELADDLGAASWRRWRAPLDLAPGTHVVSARCIAADGTIQQEERTPPFPDGVTGHHTLELRVQG